MSKQDDWSHISFCEDTDQHPQQQAVVTGQQVAGAGTRHLSQSPNSLDSAGTYVLVLVVADLLRQNQTQLTVPATTCLGITLFLSDSRQLGNKTQQWCPPQGWSPPRAGPPLLLTNLSISAQPSVKVLDFEWRSLPLVMEL